MIRETSYFPTFQSILSIDVRSDRRKKKARNPWLSRAFIRFSSNFCIYSCKVAFTFAGDLFTERSHCSYMFFQTVPVFRTAIPAAVCALIRETEIQAAVLQQKGDMRWKKSD